MLICTNVFLGIIIALLILLIVVLAKFSSHVYTAVNKVQTDIDQVAVEAKRLTSSLNAFVQSDLHKISEDTSGLIGKLTDLTSDINNKSHSLDCVFKPFGFLSAKMKGDSSEDESASPYKTIPQMLGWIATGIFIIKKARELKRKL